MKKLICVLLVLCAAVSLGACSLNEVSVKYKPVEGGLAVTSYTDKTMITEFTVPDEVDGVPVVAITDFGLCNAESLTKITIGKNVKEIGEWALTNNQHVTEYAVDPENEYFCAVDGVLFTKDMKTLCFYPSGRNIEFDKYGTALNTTEYAIPDGVEVIRSKAFYKCYYVDVTAFPDSITRIEEKAFHRASALTDFDVPANLTHIGKDAFAYDSLLTELTLPATIKEIGEYAFFNCTGMKKLTILAKEADVTLGNKWQPTEKGRVSKNCEITFAE
jgi:hypothetical protein